MNAPKPSGVPRDARRIWIVGPTGSGKSTVARELAQRLRIRAYHLDEYYHLPGWHSREPKDFTLTVKRITNRPAWIVDGNYGLVRRPFLSRADFIIWLDVPLRITLPRLIVRSLTRAAFRTPCCNGNTETFRQIFASHDSILLWAMTAGHRNAKALAKEVEPRPHVRLRSAREVRAWLNRIV